jgi:hypothetical protein
MAPTRTVLLRKDTGNVRPSVFARIQSFPTRLSGLAFNTVPRVVQPIIDNRVEHLTTMIAKALHGLNLSIKLLR